MFESTKHKLSFMDDDDAMRTGEKWLWVIANVIMIPAFLLTQYESDMGIFGTVDPLFTWWFAINIMFLSYSAIRSRTALVSYTLTSPNYHSGIREQKPLDMPFLPQHPDSSHPEKTTIYDDANCYIKGISWPRLSYKRTVIITSKTHIDEMPWGPFLKTKLRRYAGIDHKCLPPHITEDLARQDTRNIKFRFGGTCVYYSDYPDKNVARYTARPARVNGEEFYWVRGGQYNIPHDQAKEEIANAEIHDYKRDLEILEMEYEKLTGMPFSDDLEEDAGATQ